MAPEELTAAVRYQIGALKAFLDAEDMPLHHVKPHGILYGMMYRDKEVCRAVYAGVPPGTTVFGLAGTIHEEVAKELGLPFVAELYGDVKYNADKTLVIDRKKKYAGFNLLEIFTYDSQAMAPRRDQETRQGAS